MNALEHVLDALSDSAFVIHTTENYKGDPKVKVSPTDGANAHEYSFKVVSPPFVAEWVRLNGEGNLGGRFSKEKRQAKFEVTLKQGGLAKLAGIQADCIESCQLRFFNRLDEICNRVANHIFKDGRCALGAKSRILKTTKQAVAILRGTSIENISDDDPDLKKMFVKHFLGARNPFVKTNRDGDKIVTLRKRVYQPSDWKDRSKPDVIVPIPILNADDKILNEDNSEPIVKNGDLIHATFKMEPYILPNGAYGVSASLVSVTKIKSAPQQIGEKPKAKRQKLDILFSEFEK